MNGEYVPKGMVLPHGDPEIDADTTSRVNLPEIARRKEAEIGHQPGGLAAYLETHGLAAEEVPSTSSGTTSAVAEPKSAVAELVEAPATTSPDDDFELLDLDDVSKPSANVRFPDRFDLPYEEGDDFDIHLK